MKQKTHMLRLVAAGFGILLLSLFWWRFSYGKFTYNWLTLMPLGLAFYIGGYKVQIEARQATLNAALTDTTWLRRWLKGRVHAFIFSSLITLTALPVILYKTLVAELPELLVIAGLYLVCILVYTALLAHTVNHIAGSFRPSIAAAGTQWLVGIPFFLAYCYFLYQIENHPGDLLQADLKETFIHYVNKLPQGYGSQGKLMEMMAASDALKMFALVRTGALSPEAGFVYVFYGAFTSFLLVKSATSLAAFVNFYLSPGNPL